MLSEANGRYAIRFPKLSPKPKRSMTKEKHIDGLAESSTTTITLDCSKCDAVIQEWCVDDLDAAQTFYKKGWRMGTRNVYCPKCAKKYLSQSKQQ